MRQGEAIGTTDSGSKAVCAGRYGGSRRRAKWKEGSEVAQAKAQRTRSKTPILISHVQKQVSVSFMN